MSGRPCETIKPRDQDGVESAMPGICHEPVQFRTAILGSGDPDVNILASEREAAVPGTFPERDNTETLLLIFFKATLDQPPKKELCDNVYA